MSPLHARLRGLAALLALLAFVVGVPLLLLAADEMPDPAAFSWSRLTAPDDGTLALEVITAVCWIAWAVFTYQLLASVVSRIRGLRAPRLPGLAKSQVTADRLVAAAALLFVAIPSATAILPPPRAEAAMTATPLPERPTVTAAPAAVVPAKSAVEAKTEPDIERYTVKRGDSLWKIAEERLGDGTRYVELVDLNHAVLDGRPDFLVPGTALTVPTVEGPPADGYVVQPGDTLSEIARDELGDATAYPSIFEASRDTVQTNGAHLTDPDLIFPGWRLTIPGEEIGQPTHSEHRHDHSPPEPRPTAPEPAKKTPSSGLATADATSDRTEDLPSWVLPGLAGAGAVLAGSLLLVLRQHRRTQLRYRRPGHVLMPPPPELRPAEKSAHACGAITAPRIEALDRALRHLGDPNSACPRLVTAALTATAITLKLGEPAAMPAPWFGEGTTWTIALADIPADRPGSVAPYPLLVSVGTDADGRLVLANLEELRSAVLTGDARKAAALGRHIAAELALNPWSTLVEVDTLGIGDELADIDPARLHHHPEADTAFLDRLAFTLGGENPAFEPDQYRALITTGSATDGETVHEIAKVITSYPGRSGAAVLTIGGECSSGEVEMRLNAEGRVSIEGLDLELRAASLTADEASACARLVDLTRETSTVPASADDDPAHPADTGGALKPDLTSPRPAHAPAGSGSLLPLSVEEYVDRAATVAEDVHRLAPIAAPGAAAQVEAQDPELDEDVARWRASRLIGPKLTLLGPVTARTLGDPRKMARRRPFYVELLAFLVLHPSGATADEISEAFGIQPERARKDIGILRGWLGTDPRTSEPHLPNARQTHTGGVKAKYAVNGVATDLDLFRRLRTRGQSRGQTGIDDLQAALSLVSGEPFSDLRPTGWGWLLDGERFDHLMSCAIVDTAHILTTHALSTGDLELARFAAETACDAAPYDETSLLDLIAVEKAAGHDEIADRNLVEGVLNRSDDDLGPIEIPEHTAAIIRQRGWDDRRTRSAG